MREIRRPKPEIRNPKSEPVVSSWNKLTPMKQKRHGINGAIRYSEAFKMEVVRELENKDLPFAEVQRKYGVKGCDTVQRWVQQYGNGSRGKVIRVQRPEEINEHK